MTQPSSAFSAAPADDLAQISDSAAEHAASFAFDFDELVRLKVCEFLNTVSGHYPDKLYKLLMAKMEKPLLSEVLKQAGGNQAKAARILGLTRNTLHRKLKHHNLKITKSSAQQAPDSAAPPPPTAPL